MTKIYIKAGALPYAYKAEYAVNTDKIAGYQIAGTPQQGEILKYNGTQWIPSSDNEGTGIDNVNAGGDLAGTYPNPTVAKLQGKTVATTAPTTGQVLKYNGTQWIPDTDIEGTGSIDGTVAAGDLSGTYPNPTVAKLQGKTVAATTPTTGQVLKYNGTTWAPAADIDTDTNSDDCAGCLTIGVEVVDPGWLADGDDVGGLTLPYSDTLNGADDAFAITYLGSENIKLASFVVDNANSNANALHIQSNGTDEPLFVRNDGTDDAIRIHTGTSSSKGIDIHHNGTREAVFVYHEGDEDCTHFQIYNSNNSNNVIVASTNGTGYAGYFYGNVHITGTVSKSSTKTVIDNPLNPKNEILSHSTLESNEMLNVYSGNAILNENGKVVVDLPEWFESLNTQFRYQLTCIGGFANVYIAKEIENNQFSIAGGTKGLKVSWQVTAVRSDPYAKANPMEVIKEKNAEEKGYYLHPKAYNQPVEKGISYLHEKNNLEKDKEEVNHENK